MDQMVKDIYEKKMFIPRRKPLEYNLRGKFGIAKRYVKGISNHNCSLKG
jgi:hypothetical protein